MSEEMREFEGSTTRCSGPPVVDQGITGHSHEEDTPHPPLPISDHPAPIPSSYRGYFSKPFFKAGGAGGEIGLSGSLMEPWMEFNRIQKGHVASGIERYALSVQAFLTWLQRTDRDHDPLTISRATVEEWLKSLFYDQGNTNNRTRSGKLSALRSFFAWLVYAGYRSDDPTSGIPSPKIVPGQPQKFSTEELHKIFSAPDLTKPRGIRDLAILMTLYAAGPRVSELCNLETTQVLDTGGYIRLRFTGVKGGGDRTITLRTTAAAALRNWLVLRRGMPSRERAVFVRLAQGVHTRITVGSTQKLLKRYAASVGIDDAEVFAHKMRATAITDYYDSGDDCCARCGGAVRKVGLMETQLFAGHADPKTTLAYIAVTERQLRQQAIPEKRFHEIIGGKK